MIHSLRLQNFKPFQEQHLQFRPLTLLSGVNSSGKSSVLQALLLLRQSYQQGLLPKNRLALNGDLVCIGTDRDALFEGAKEKSIGFDIVWTNDMKGSWRFDSGLPDRDREVYVLSVVPLRVVDEVYKSSLFSNKFHYIMAERIGPRQFCEISRSSYGEINRKQLGTKGEYAAHFLAINRHKEIPNSQLGHPEEKSRYLLTQVNAWMEEIRPGTHLEIDCESDVDRMSVQYFYRYSNGYRATNVGFGIAYSLPIIVAALASEPGTLILIENPEAYLHPKGQAKIGELLALAASCGVQVVIESHSDHLLNGIRVAVHGGKIKPDDVQLHYFHRQVKDRQATVEPDDLLLRHRKVLERPQVKDRQAVIEVISPRIDRNGRIDQWPDGFFDEWDKSLEALLAPAGE